MHDCSSARDVHRAAVGSPKLCASGEHGLRGLEPAARVGQGVQHRQVCQRPEDRLDQQIPWRCDVKGSRPQSEEVWHRPQMPCRFMQKSGVQGSNDLLRSVPNLCVKHLTARNSSTISMCASLTCNKCMFHSARILPTPCRSAPVQTSRRLLQFEGGQQQSSLPEQIKMMCSPAELEVAIHMAWQASSDWQRQEAVSQAFE